MIHPDNEGELRFSELLQQIEKCVRHELFSVAIITSLAIPDIAGAINSKNGQADKNKYASWFDKFCKPKFKSPGNYCLTGNDCYYLRCSVLHQGKAEHQELNTFSDIIFSEIPQALNSVNPIFLTKNNILLIEPKSFCNKMSSAAYDWLEDAHKNDNFKKNTNKFLNLFSLIFNELPE